jgi:hypothetical protein
VQKSAFQATKFTLTSFSLPFILDLKLYYIYFLVLDFERGERNSLENEERENIVG